MVCLNPKADFGAWINFEHTIQFTYYTDCLPLAPNAISTEAGILLCPVHSWISSSRNTAGHRAAQYLTNGSNRHKFKVCQDQGGKDVRNENPLPLPMGARTCTMFDSNLAMSSKTEIHMVILLLVIYALQKFWHRCQRRHLSFSL